MKHQLEKLQKLTENKNLDLIIIHAPDNIEYFTGIPSIGDIVALLIHSRMDNKTYLYVPVLEYHRYRVNLPDSVEVYAVSKTIKPEDIPIVELDWKDIIAKHSENKDKIGADVHHPGPLQLTIARALGERVLNVSEDIWNLRAIKEEHEIKAIEKAIEITQRGIQAILAELREGVTELELAGVFEYTARKHGAEKTAFDPIVAFKPNNAYPHTAPGARPLKKDDLVLVDVGVKYGGRCSDITRMIIWGKITNEEKQALEALIEAVNSSIDYAKPGVTAQEVYNTAVAVLEKYGLKEKFIHGLGHGIGVAVHEPPFLRPLSGKTLEPGMVFTIEPGVYIPGSYGVRIEEDVLITKTGAKVLSSKLSRVLETL